MIISNENLIGNAEVYCNLKVIKQKNPDSKVTDFMNAIEQSSNRINTYYIHTIDGKDYLYCLDKYYKIVDGSIKRSKPDAVKKYVRMTLDLGDSLVRIKPPSSRGKLHPTSYNKARLGDPFVYTPIDVEVELEITKYSNCKSTKRKTDENLDEFKALLFPQSKYIVNPYDTDDIYGDYNPSPGWSSASSSPSSSQKRSFAKYKEPGPSIPFGAVDAPWDSKKGGNITKKRLIDMCRAKKLPYSGKCKQELITMLKLKIKK